MWLLSGILPQDIGSSGMRKHVRLHSLLRLQQLAQCLLVTQEGIPYR